jgi:carbon-monoxide dehydrogenase large subunit
MEVHQSSARVSRPLENATSEKLVGLPIKRVEDKRLLTGMDRYLDNIKLPGMAYAGFVRSPYAHAKIREIDLDQVEKNPQVVAVLLPEEVRSDSEPIPVIWRVPGAKLHEHYALAQGKVKHVGDPVVAVAVSERNSLEDALESVQVEYEPLESVLDPASAETAPPLHEELGTNRCYEVPIRAGDVDAAFRDSQLKVSGQFKIGRVAASPMETRGVIADPYGTDGEMIVYSSTQWPHVLRTCLARCLRVPEIRLRVIGPDVGGGFGVKGEVYGEEIAVPLLAKKCGRPVKWVESRTESFLATAHSRSQTIDAEASFTKDGIITGLRINLLCDFGAYLHTITMGCAFITAISFNGPYHLPNVSITAKAVYTNKVPLSAYRGFGQPEAAFVVERLMSMAAARLGLDQAEIRFRNFIQPEEMPYATSSGGMYDSGDYPASLKKTMEMSGYNNLLEQRDRERKAGRLRGVGVSVYTETTGFAPGFVFSHFGLAIGGFDSATARLDPQGKLFLTTGAFPHGQGFNTVATQIGADELGLSPDDVHVYHGDTLVSPYGHGSFGSRTVAVAGNALVLSSRKVAEKVVRIAASMLKTDPKELQLSRGLVASRLDPSMRVSVREVAASAYRAHDLPQDVEPGLESTVYFNPVGLATSYAAHVCDVEVDPESGVPKILNHYCVHDCGKQINPMIVDGQLHGAIAQAVGASLLEEIVFDEGGQLLSDSFLDYLIPTAESMPGALVLDSITTPTPLNLLGAKGVGESGTIIAPPAILNAISDAIGEDVNEIPATPERLWKVLLAVNRSSSKLNRRLE